MKKASYGSAMYFTLLLLLMTWFWPLYAAEDFDRQQILQRIQPIGNVNIEGQSEHALPNSSSVVVSQAIVKKLPGQATYEKYCVVCHQDGVAGAPKFRNETDWKPRVTELKLAGLIATAIKGINVMPPKGTCGECSEEDIKNAIQYMLPRS